MSDPILRVILAFLVFLFYGALWLVAGTAVALVFGSMSQVADKPSDLLIPAEECPDTHLATISADSVASALAVESGRDPGMMMPALPWL